MLLPSSAALDNCVVVIELFAISLDPTALAAILAAVTELSPSFAFVTLALAIFAVVTCDAPICIVSILPVTSSAESTEFDANKS